MVLLLLVVGCGAPPAQVSPYLGAVVALQDASSLALVDLDGASTGTLPLSTEEDGVLVPWMIHNVQVAPDRRTAIATAMRPMDDSGTWTGIADQLVVVDLATLGVRRCTLDVGLGAAHVVTDGATAWITGYDQDRVVVVDLATCATTDRWPLPPGTGPHGLRRSVDGASVYVAGLDGDVLLRVSLTDGSYTAWDLPGHAVQVAVLPDGSAVLATLADTRQVARLDLATEGVTVFDLPASAQGPAQVYPSPDSASVWVADQGLADAPVPGRELFQVDAATGAVIADVVVDEGPHGVVVSADGGTVWSTTLGFDTLVRVDVATSSVLGSTPLGGGPNGISLAEETGAAP